MGNLFDYLNKIKIALSVLLVSLCTKMIQRLAILRLKENSSVEKGTLLIEVLICTLAFIIISKIS